MNAEINFQKEDHIGIITLNRSGHQNTITSEMAMAFSEIKDQFGYGSDITVIVITGEGESFCTGTDCNDDASFESREEKRSRLQVASTVGALNQPVIAAINGDAFDQGLELALACDIRIASLSAHFAMRQINDGIMPWDGGTQRLSRLVGGAKALELILLGEVLDAGEALKIGLVSHVASEKDILASALNLARRLAEKGPIALRYAKEAIYQGMDMTLEQGLRLEADLYFLLHTTEDRTEGITAFREKRPPAFRGT